MTFECPWANSVPSISAEWKAKRCPLVEQLYRSKSPVARSKFDFLVAGFLVAGVARLQSVLEKPNSGESGYQCKPNTSIWTKPHCIPKISKMLWVSSSPTTGSNRPSEGSTPNSVSSDLGTSKAFGIASLMRTW